ALIACSVSSLAPSPSAVYRLSLHDALPIFVLVDGDDDLAALHAGQVLNGAGDADRDVEVGRHHLTGLADLIVVGREAGIHRGTGGADGSAELVGQLFDQLEVFLAAHAPAAGHHDAGISQLRTVGLGQLLLDEAHLGISSRRSDLLDAGTAAT